MLPAPSRTQPSAAINSSICPARAPRDRRSAVTNEKASAASPSPAAMKAMFINQP
jgi:hypothetical protein